MTENGSKLLRRPTPDATSTNRLDSGHRVHVKIQASRDSTPMKEKRTARLPHRAASTRRISASAPARRSLDEGGFFTLCISLGVFVFFVALFARLAAGRPHHAELNSPASSHPIGIVIAGDGAEGASCQYIITPASDPYCSRHYRHR